MVVCHFVLFLLAIVLCVVCPSSINGIFKLYLSLLHLCLFLCEYCYYCNVSRQLLYSKSFPTWVLCVNLGKYVLFINIYNDCLLVNTKFILMCRTSLKTIHHVGKNVMLGWSANECIKGNTWNSRWWIGSLPYNRKPLVVAPIET